MNKSLQPPNVLHLTARQKKLSGIENIDFATSVVMDSLQKLQSCKKEDLAEECVRAKMIVESAKTVVFAEQTKLNMVQSFDGVFTNE